MDMIGGGVGGGVMSVSSPTRGSNRVETQIDPSFGSSCSVDRAFRVPFSFKLIMLLIMI